MTPHDEVLSALLDTPDLNLEVRLLGRVDDPLVGNASDREVFLFVPDLHVITPERARAYGAYGFNHADQRVLARLLQRLARLREEWRRAGTRLLLTTQVGDFFDLWREFEAEADPNAIADDAHGELRDVLYRGLDRGLPCLDATILLGNHDTKRGVKLPEIQFQLKAFNPTAAAGNPFLFTTHGDAFDLLERLVPDAIEEFIVHFAGPRTPVNKYSIADWGQAAAGSNKPLDQLGDCIVKARHDLDAATGARRVEPEQALPARVARVITEPDQTDHGRFAQYYESLHKAHERGLYGGSVRVVVVGHSHEATMILCEPPGGRRPLVMMDTGAWIEQCTYPLAEGGTARPEPSAQLGVIHGNDVRLYQIRVLPPA
jgi:UDP-2,3-diacylglucosamine pyrophosphatase LpxH